MISSKLKELVAKLENKGEMCFLEGATEEQITEFEKKNSTKFPAEYKEWLSFSDGGEFFLPAGIQLYGVAHKPLIDVEEDDRPDDNYIVLGALSSGDPIIFKKGEEAISIFNHEAGVIEGDETYPSFWEFLNDLNNIVGTGE